MYFDEIYCVFLLSILALYFILYDFSSEYTHFHMDTFMAILFVDWNEH